MGGITLDWTAIRPLNGGRGKGFEELCSQLARAEAPQQASRRQDIHCMRWTWDEGPRAAPGDQRPRDLALAEFSRTRPRRVPAPGRGVAQACAGHRAVRSLSCGIGTTQHRQVCPCARGVHGSALRTVGDGSRQVPWAGIGAGRVGAESTNGHIDRPWHELSCKSLPRSMRDFSPCCFLSYAGHGLSVHCCGLRVANVRVLPGVPARRCGADAAG